MWNLTEGVEHVTRGAMIAGVEFILLPLPGVLGMGIDKPVFSGVAVAKSLDAWPEPGSCPAQLRCLDGAAGYGAACAHCAAGLPVLVSFGYAHL